MNRCFLALLVNGLLASLAFGQNERTPIPAQPSSAWAKHSFPSEEKPRFEYLEVEYVPFKKGIVKKHDMAKGRVQHRVAWEIKLVDVESGLPIARRFVNTRRVMMCGTGYVPWYHYREGGGSDIVLTGPDGVARFDGQLGNRKYIQIYGDVAKCGDSAVDYRRATLTLPAGQEGFLGRVTVALHPRPSEKRRLWVLDENNGRGLLGANVSVALEWESFAAGQGVEFDEVPRVLLGSTDAKGSLEVPLAKGAGSWFIAEAPGYTPKWFWAYDERWKDSCEDWFGRLGKEGVKRNLDWPERLEVRLGREGSISGQVRVGSFVSSEQLWVVVDWEAEKMFDKGEPSEMDVFIGERKPRLEVRAAVGPTGMFRANGIPSAIPLRIKVIGQSTLHETVNPVELKSGEQQVWDWSLQDGVALELSLPERWANAELYSTPNELLGWAPLPTDLFLYSGSVPIVKGSWAEPIPEHIRQEKALRWMGLAPGRYLLRFVGLHPKTNGYRTLVFDLEQDRVVTLPSDKPCTFLLPKGKYADRLQLRAVHAETGEWFLGGKDLTGCQWTEGRLRMWMPDGEYYLALAYKGPDACQKVFGRHSVGSGKCIDLSTAELNGGGRLSVTVPGVQGSREDMDRAVDRIFLGTVYQGNEPIMGVWADSRRSYRTSTVGLPVGEFEFRPVLGEPQAFSLERRGRVRIRVPAPEGAR